MLPIQTFFPKMTSLSTAKRRRGGSERGNTAPQWHAARAAFLVHSGKCFAMSCTFDMVTAWGADLRERQLGPSLASCPPRNMKHLPSIFAMHDVSTRLGLLRALGLFMHRLMLFSESILLGVRYWSSAFYEKRNVCIPAWYTSFVTWCIGKGESCKAGARGLVTALHNAPFLSTGTFSYIVPASAGGGIEDCAPYGNRQNWNIL